MCDCAVGTISRANVAKDHESGGAMLPAFADVGAVRLLANRVEVELTHHVLEPQVVRSARSLNLEPRWLALGKGLDAMPTHYLV